MTRQRYIQVPPEQVFEALTTVAGLRYWFCDSARTEPRVVGCFKVGWHSGYEVRGRFTALDPGQRVALTWHGSGEPAETQVTFELAEAEGGTTVTVTHAG